MNKIWLFIFFFFFILTNAIAHGDLHKRILKITEKLNENPKDAKLYFERGDLYYKHNDYTNSIKDLKKSISLGYKSEEHYFLMAKCNFQLEKYQRGKKFANKVLKNHQKNPAIYNLLGDIYFEQNKFKKSAQNYEKVITYSKVLYPEIYIKAARAWHAEGSQKGREQSNHILKKGTEALGDLIVLYNQLVSNFIDSNNYIEAIKFQLKIISISPRKERAYLKLAAIQEMQDDYIEALVSINYAKSHYKSLPFRIKNTSFMKKFYSNLKMKEESLKMKTL